MTAKPRDESMAKQKKDVQGKVQHVTTLILYPIQYKVSSQMNKKISIKMPGRGVKVF